MKAMSELHPSISFGLVFCPCCDLRVYGDPDGPSLLVDDWLHLFEECDLLVPTELVIFVLRTSYEVFNESLRYVALGSSTVMIDDFERKLEVQI